MASTIWLKTNTKEILVNSLGEILLCEICPCVISRRIIDTNPVPEEVCGPCDPCADIWDLVNLTVGDITAPGFETANGTWALTRFSSPTFQQCHWRGPIFILPDNPNTGSGTHARWALFYFTEGFSESPFIVKTFGDCKWCLHLAWAPAGFESMLDDPDILEPFPHSEPAWIVRSELRYGFNGLSDANARSNGLCLGDIVYARLMLENIYFVDQVPNWVILDPQI